MPKQRTSAGGFDAGEPMDTVSTEGQADGGTIVEQAKAKAQAMASQAQQKTSEQVKASVSTGKQRAAETVDSLAQSLRSSGQQLRDQNHQVAGEYIDHAARRVERLATYLHQTEVKEMVAGIEDFARERPGVFLGGAFALGVLGARFLKSSGRRNAGQPGQRDGRRPERETGGLPAERDVTGTLRATPGRADASEWDVTRTEGSWSPTDRFSATEP